MSGPQIVSLAQAGIGLPWGLSTWRAGEPEGHTVHWEGAGGHADHAFCLPEWRSIDAFHRARGYTMVAYNYGVCNHGVVYEGRPIGYQSAAQRDGNRLRIALCYIAGPAFPFTLAARGALGWLVNNGPGRSRGRAIGHRDEPSCSTSCPGDPIEVWIKTSGWTGAPAPVTRPAPSPHPNPLPPNGFRHPLLRQGSVGPAVMEAQRKLVGGAGQILAIDGVFGPKTRAAVINVQRWCHLQVDGIVGRETWNLLDFVAAVRGLH